ncbi:MAG: hypothetical protein LBI05_08975 [Planctomycetaceae bacterium]|nr:hypothetical protein [Planctomycetaceae bacterium]
MLLIFFVCFSAVAMADDRSLYNRGAELAASGNFDEAVEILRQVAVVRDRTIAAKALSLLGQIAAGSAKQCVAENPAETSPEQRKKVFDHIQSAEQNFSESLSLRSNTEVRRNLETLRAWRHNMANEWEEYDREQQRQKELQQQIQWLADWEEKLMGNVRPMLNEPESPRKAQSAYESAREQKKFVEELTRLEKMSINDDELKEQWEHLPEIQKTAAEATELLAKHRIEEALPKQQEVLDYLRSLLKQEQNQDSQNQEQNEQDQQNQENQEQSQEENEQQNEKNSSARNQQDETTQPEESPEEKAERQLIQVRRKEQAAKELRELVRALMMQADPVGKDW